MKSFKIGNRYVGGDNPTLVIAEAGINHQGEIKYAKQLIDIASFAGADAVKFQKRTVDRILTKEGLEMPYENPNSFGKTYGEHKRALELSAETYRELKIYAEEKELIFLASVWDEESADFIDDISTAAFKLPSADLTNLPLLEHVAKKGKPVILSAGMADLEEVRLGFNTVAKFNNEIALLQCTSTYPVKFEEINLNVMKTFENEFDCVVGYSGHERGIAIAPVAVALGAKIVERHFTTDRTMKGGDHAASLEVQGLQRMIRDIRHVEVAMGDGQKRMYESEIKVREKLAKSIVTATSLEQGTILTRDMLTTKGPGTGIPPSRLAEAIGKKIKCDLGGDVVIREEHIEW